MQEMKKHRKQIAVLFISLFLVMVGFGIILPVLPFLVTHHHGTSTSLGLLMASYSVMQFIFAPIWGRISDRIGRRPVLLIGLSGYGITFLVFGLASQLWMLFAIRMLSGMVSSATLPTAMAYIADITSHENRAAGMGMMGAAMGLGMIFGPALGGWLGNYGLAAPFLLAGGLAILTLPFAFFFLPESLKEPVVQSENRSRRFNRWVVKNPQFPLFCLAFCVSFSMALFESTFALFSAERVGFGPKEMGMLFALMGVLGVIVQMSLIGRMVKRFGDVTVIRFGVTMTALGFVLILLAPNLALLVFFTCFFSMGNALLRPSISTLVTKTSTAGQGASVGMNQSFESLGRIFGPTLGGAVYGINTDVPYLLGFVVLAIILTATWAKLNGFACMLKGKQVATEV